MSESFLRLFARGEKFEPETGTVRSGLTTYDDERFLRLLWEVPTSNIGRQRTWVPISKGGNSETFYAEVHLVLKWNKVGAEVGAHNINLYDSDAQSRRASRYYYRPASTFSRRAGKWFAVRPLPPNTVFGDVGPVIISESDITPGALLAFFNSDPTRVIVHLQAQGGGMRTLHVETGLLKAIPWPDISKDSLSQLEEIANSAWKARIRQHAYREEDPHFDIHELLSSANIELRADACRANIEAADLQVKELVCKASQIVSDAYGLNGVNFSDFGISSEQHLFQEHPFDSGLPQFAECVASSLIGIALGRFKASFGSEPVVPDSPWKEEFPSMSSSFASTEEYSGTTPLVDDPGHPADLLSIVEKIAHEIWKDSADEGVAALRVALNSTSSGEQAFRLWIAKKYFERHVKRYTKSRRKAPIYWQLATPSAAYSVWLYYHRLTKDTFFQVRNDYVKPKLHHERQKLERVRGEGGAEPTRSQRKEIEDQEKFVAELAGMAEEVERIAPLWNPNLNDGVIINFAPLWRLVPQNKSWQKECKKCWDKLVKGEYDWAHLAMRLWPERVVPKCVTDASLAIAHGLEEVFCDQDDRDRFQPKEEPEGGWEPVIKNLIDERTSPAVKAALESLLAAPAPAGSSKSRRRKATT